jgi:Superfamily I DNA and RNA helicases and helicase subunits
MTEQEKYFDGLVKIREYLADALEFSAAKGVKGTVVEKYSDQAHFIYELLQNADDAKATRANFRLMSNGLYFTHNGTIHFTISRPDTLEDKKIEEKDKNDGKLGHINSITSIGNSAKEIQSSTIGKFGVGFKAVFQYTETPHIYDSNFRFKINRFIVPQLLDSDLEDRKSNETIFYFPFDKNDVPKEKAYEDIIEKFQKIVYPTLFLSNLKEVCWKAENESGNYLKEIIKTKQSGNIYCEKIELSQQIDLNITNEKLWLFTRFIEGQHHRYSVGFFLDENGKLKPKQTDAFCFFPTKENTGLNFIVHSPFLLNDSREGIKRSENHNTKMINLLAELSADSLLILKDLKLIDDNIIKLIPYKKLNEFFLPFYEKIREKFQTEELLPSNDGTFVKKENAYWADTLELSKLFSNEQLAALVNNPDAKWVFTSIVRSRSAGGDEIADYIDGGKLLPLSIQHHPNLIKSYISFEKDIVEELTKNFIQKQDFEWLHKFYEFLSDSEERKKRVKTKPIFRDVDNNAVAAFRQEDKTKQYYNVLFLPTYYKDPSNIIIHNELLSNEASLAFIKAFGIKEPDLKDEIRKISKSSVENISKNFNKLFNYYKEFRDEEFIDLIKDKEFILYKTNEDSTTHCDKASEIYYPYPDLQKYFETKQDTKFVVLENYHSSVMGEKDKKTLKEFLLKIGVSDLPRIITETTKNNKDKIDNLSLGFRQKRQDNHTWSIIEDKLIDGCEDVTNSNDEEKSIILWNFLQRYSCNTWEKGVHTYARTTYFDLREDFESSELQRLKVAKWFVNKNGDFVAPHEITVNELSDKYDTSNKQLIELLGFIDSSNTSSEDKEWSDLSKEDKRKLLELHKKSSKQNSSNTNSEQTSYSNGYTENNRNDTECNTTDRELKEYAQYIDSLETKTENEIEKIKTEAKIKLEENKQIAEEETTDEEWQQEIERLVNEKRDLIKKRGDLKNKLQNNKYSYEWFKSYLELLLTYNKKPNTNKPQKSFSFQSIKQYTVDGKVIDKYFLLSGCSSFIPASIEDNKDFHITLLLKQQQKESIEVESVSKRGQDLLLNCPQEISSSIIEQFENVLSVKIEYTPNTDLLFKLYKVFNENNLEKWDKIEKALPPLQYIYGPPGTGKTTSLCELINEKLKNDEDKKFLILTPTNTASDVLCKRLLNKFNSNTNIVRLGSPTDFELEEKIYKEFLTISDIEHNNIIASTIHRLPYCNIDDGIEGSNKLFQSHWDYIIFDESSMIGLHYIVFAILALYKTNPSVKFIVAGDPKQIPPVIEINDDELENFDFQDENIYRMMGLSSFKPEEQIVREQDKIQNLNTQYRSVKQIGQLFSELSYSNLLEHDREKNPTEENKSKVLPDEFRKMISSHVTFINIPLKDDSIYKVGKLNGSSYQIYSAILVAEIIKYFDSANNIDKSEKWKIGLIAPYKAQATLLNKLIKSYEISDNLVVYAETVHGFQGDDCDIVFFVCNPNSCKYKENKKSLLSKEYIYNVAISRAKDYLIILHPFAKIKNNELINRIVKSHKYKDSDFLRHQSSKIEKTLFGSETYIYDNSDSTGLDTVNIFGVSKMKYLVKANESTIDIQLKPTLAGADLQIIKTF